MAESDDRLYQFVGLDKGDRSLLWRNQTIAFIMLFIIVYKFILASY
ncbi:MAG: hypothetical protein RMY29_033060 [Nostoc sp. CreGUA01]